MAQWLGFRACTAGGTNLISAQGTETLQALQKGPKKKERKKRMRGKKSIKEGKEDMKNRGQKGMDCGIRRHLIEHPVRKSN